MRTEEKQKAEKTKMRCTHDEKESGGGRRGTERRNVDHIEYEALFVSRCHICDLIKRAGLASIV